MHYNLYTQKKRIHFGITRAQKTKQNIEIQLEKIVERNYCIIDIFTVFMFKYRNINGRISMHSTKMLCTCRAIKLVFMETQTNFAEPTIPLGWLTLQAFYQR